MLLIPDLSGKYYRLNLCIVPREYREEQVKQTIIYYMLTLKGIRTIKNYRTNP